MTIRRFLSILACRILPAAAAACILAGCSSVVNSHKQKEDMMGYYLNGENEDALDEIEYKLREPAWYNTSVVNTGDELVWRLEAGSMNFHVGNFQESIEQFRIAEDLIEKYDERAEVSARERLAFEKWKREVGWTKLSDYVKGALPLAVRSMTGR